ncbi:MAG: tRNA uridine-5-carboxymethylaminomethyl(34) synthesis enzyme MnmG [Rikenellaceae bacterium]
MKFNYDIIVVGGGHAGCEAAVAAARLGASTLLVTMDMEKLAAMSCNPAIGGVAKGQIVREIDALGGMMGVVTDLSTIQFRMLGRSKGPAMWSPRAQCDRHRYCDEWRKVVDNTDNLSVWQDSVADVICEDGVIKGVRTLLGVTFLASAVVLTCGTFLSGLMHVGEHSTPGGRAGDSASYGITQALKNLGFQADRMKTGTPVRIDSRTIDFSVMEPQSGDSEPSKFSFLESSKAVEHQLPCYLVYTSSEVHDILRTGFSRSPLLTGVIKGIGPRYCPSIEDKLRTFSEKDSHQLFLEPESLSTNEYYLNGFSSSLPLEVQVAALNTIKGLENAQIYRAGYAIEYDFFPPTQLRHTLETKLIEGLYFAGQINGTTGYEEAAAQGLLAAINAVLKIRGEQALVLGRDESYIGVLIDDLVTKGVDEPYRMFTSRAEYRILLRQDNAEERLTPAGRRVGLVDDIRWAEYSKRSSERELLMAFIRKNSVIPEQVASYLAQLGQSNITQKRPIIDVLVRNGIELSTLRCHIEPLDSFIIEHNISADAISSIEILVKYGGYIERERANADKLHRLEGLRIPDTFDFNSLESLSIESRQKLTKIRPQTIGQASRIPGVSPADISVMLIYFGR